MEHNDGNVREMTRTEKNFYRGVTIEAGSTDGGSSEENFRREKNYGCKTRTAYVSYGGSNFFTRLLGNFIAALLKGNRPAQIGAFLIGLALAALAFFIALPILFFLLALGIGFLLWSKISR